MSTVKYLVHIVLLVFLNYCISVTHQTTQVLKDNHEIECPGGTLLSSRICIPQGYRKGEPPNKPVEIRTSLSIEHIREIDDRQMTITLEISPILSWVDNRIITNLTVEEKRFGAILNNVALQDLWKPDLRIDNMRSFQIHSIIESVSGLAIGGVGSQTIVWYQFAAKVTIYCNFDFHRYPMDKQECNFTIGSAYPAKNAVAFTYNASAFYFAKERQNTDSYDISITSNNENMYNITQFGFTIRMNRRMQHYAMECYIPCTTISVVAPVSFVISFESIPGRFALLMTLFLTLTNLCIYTQVIKIK